MPRKTRSSRKKATEVLSESSVKKLAAIAELTEKDNFEDLIRDFDIQADKLVRQTKRLFANETKKLSQFLPQKTSIPKEIIKMSGYEFKERGGTLEAVMESWKRDKQAGQSLGVSSASSVTVNTTANKENEAAASKPVISDDVNPDFVTPALNTRSKALIANGPAYTGNVTKRKPNPLEHVELSVCATTSGSPVDEQVFMKMQIGHVLEDLESQLLESVSAFPQKWRSKLQKSLKNARQQVNTQMQDNYFQTPALKR